MREYTVGPGEDIQLGHRWEHHARRIVFDISAWVKDFGAGTAQLLNQRQGDASPYPVAVTRTDPDKVTVNNTTGTLILWDVTAVDTNCQYSRAELRYYRGTQTTPDFLVKSDIHKAKVEAALGAALADAPAEDPDWLATLLDAAGRVDAARTYAESAETYAGNAYAAQQAADSAAQAAANAAQDIGNASQRISALESGKVDKVTGKTLSTNDYTDADKAAVDTIGNKVDKVTGKALSTNDYTDADKTAVATISNKVDKVTGKTLSTNDYTDADKAAVDTIGNKVDKITGKGLSTNDYTDADKAAVDTIGNKVDKVTGKGLSTNDYTTTEKNKLSGIPSDANHTTIDATLSNAGQAAEAKATGDTFAAFRDLISRMEIHCNASGNPATFSDAAAANVKALSVTLTPTQSGSGTPYPPGGGNNLLKPYCFNNSSYGVTTSYASDGSVTLSGATGNDVGYTGGGQAYGSEFATVLPAGTYTASALFTQGSGVAAVYMSGRKESSPTTPIALADLYGVAPVTFTLDEPTSVYYYGYIRANTTCNGTMYVWVNEGSSALGYAPYANIRPISGVSSVTVTRTGENGANSTSVTISLVDSSSNPLTVYAGTLDVTTGTLSVTHKTVVLPLTGWVAEGQHGNDRFCSYSSPLPGIRRISVSENVHAVCSHYAPSTPGHTWWGTGDNTFTGGYGTDSIFVVDKRFSTAADFMAYLSEQSAANTPVQVCYELAAPVTYQLTPQQLATLSGYNAVSSDAGNVAVTYKADASLAYEALTYLILSLGGNVP